MSDDMDEEVRVRAAFERICPNGIVNGFYWQVFKAGVAYRDASVSADTARVALQPISERLWDERIAELEAALEEMRKSRDHHASTIFIQTAQIESLRAQLAEAHDAHLWIRKNRDLQAQLSAAEQDASRYRWLRECHWSESDLAVVTNPKETVRLGTLCPSGEQLDEAIDAALPETK